MLGLARRATRLARYPTAAVGLATLLVYPEVSPRTLSEANERPANLEEPLRLGLATLGGGQNLHVFRLKNATPRRSRSAHAIAPPLSQTWLLGRTRGVLIIVYLPLPEKSVYLSTGIPCPGELKLDKTIKEHITETKVHHFVTAAWKLPIQLVIPTAVFLRLNRRPRSRRKRLLGQQRDGVQCSRCAPKLSRSY